MNDEQKREWLTVTEAAEATGYDDYTVRKLAREGKIKTTKTPGTYLVYMPSLWEYIEQAQSKGKGPGTGPRKLVDGE